MADMTKEALIALMAILPDDAIVRIGNSTGGNDRPIVDHLLKSRDGKYAMVLQPEAGERKKKEATDEATAEPVAESKPTVGDKKPAAAKAA